MSYSQDHQSDSVWQKYPATILQVIKGMMGEGCTHLLSPFFLIWGKPVTDISWWFIFSSLSTGSSQERTLMSCFHYSFLPALYLPPAGQLILHFSPLLGECMSQFLLKAKWVISSQLPKGPVKSPRKFHWRAFRKSFHQSPIFFQGASFTLQTFCVNLLNKRWWNATIQILFLKILKENNPRLYIIFLHITKYINNFTY